jgi:hypothetical protein
VVPQGNSSQIQKPQSIQLNSMAMHQKQSSDYNYNSVNLDSSASRKDYLNCSSKSKNTSAIKASVQKKSMQDSLNEQARQRELYQVMNHHVQNESSI